MRKYVSILLAFVLLIALAVPAAAEETVEFKTYKLDELPFAISLPDNFDVLAVTMDPKDPVFAQHKLNGAKTIKEMADEGTILQAMTKEETSQFLVTVVSDGDMGEDFLEADEEYLAEVAEATADALKEQGWTVEESDSFISNQLDYVYVVYNGNVEGVDIYGAQFSTVYNGEMFNLTYTSFEEITEDDLDILFYIADNMNITELPVTYLDFDGRVQFAMPEGSYSCVEMTDDNIHYCARLPEGSFGYLMYSSEEVDNAKEFAKMSVKDFAKEMEVSEDLVGEETYNGQRYLFLISAEEIEAGKEKMTLQLATFVTAYDDYLYTFQYMENAADDAVNMETFEDIMKTVEFDVDVE